MSNFKVYIGDDNNKAKYVGQILDDANIAKLNNVASFPTQTGNSGKFLTTDGNAVSWNSVSEVANQSTGTIKFWTGTQTAYDAIATKDATTLYIIISAS